MNDKKVTFTMGIGLAGCCREETFTVSELGYVEGEDFNNIEELEELLEEAWKDWKDNYIDGGFEIKD